jgi:hypothetical protein
LAISSRWIQSTNHSPTDRDGKKLEENDSRDKNAIENGLTQSIHTNIMHCESAKEMWDKLKNIYEGDEKVKEAKLQILEPSLNN